LLYGWSGGLAALILTVTDHKAKHAKDFCYLKGEKHGAKTQVKARRIPALCWAT
jgi:hypothetical protein